MAARHGRRRYESFAERRERRAAVDDPAVVLEAAARFLEVRSRSVAEVRRRLTTNGYRGDLVDGAIARMTELGMLDDEAFARAWVESRDRSRPRGERAIRVELGQKGVDRAVIDEVLSARRAGGLASDDPDRPVDPDARGRVGRSNGSRAPVGQASAVTRARRRPTPASGPGLCAVGPERVRPRDVPGGRGDRGRRRGCRGRRVASGVGGLPARDEVLRVGEDAGQVRRGVRVLPEQPEERQSGHLADATTWRGSPASSRIGQVQPAVIGRIAGGPEDRADRQRLRDRGP